MALNFIDLMAFAALFLGIFIATRSRKTKPSLYTTPVFCAIAVWIARVAYNFWRAT